MKLKPLLISLAAVSALAAGAANAAQVIVTTGAGYVKMVDALAALYQKETGVAVEKSFGGNIGQMLAQVKHGSGVNVVISDEASLEKFHDALAPDARRLGDTPLVLVWRKGLELKRPRTSRSTPSRPSPRPIRRPPSTAAPPPNGSRRRALTRRSRPSFRSWAPCRRSTPT